MKFTKLSVSAVFLMAGLPKISASEINAYYTEPQENGYDVETDAYDYDYKGSMDTFDSEDYEDELNFFDDDNGDDESFVEDFYGDTDVGEEIRSRSDFVVNQFKTEGFEYAGKEEIVEFREDEEYFTDGEIDSSSGGGGKPKDKRIARVTPGGDSYIAKSSANFKPDNDFQQLGKKTKPIKEQKKGSSFPPGFDPNGDIGSDSVIGSDTRFRVPGWPAAGWPYWRVVRVGNGCSGTIVGRNKVLTNAHCVYSRSRKQWTIPSTVTPGQNGHAPWGSWNVAHATISTAYINSSNSWDYDYAILTIKNDNWTRKDIGTYMGYVPMQDANCNVLKSRNYMKRIVGYPGDKPSGTMWDSGQCDDWYYSCGSKRVYHKCDTYRGSSGSGMLLFYNNWSIRVIGVHAFGTSNTQNGWNSGVPFYGYVAAWLRTW